MHSSGRVVITHFETSRQVQSGSVPGIRASKIRMLNRFPFPTSAFGSGSRQTAGMATLRSPHSNSPLIHRPLRLALPRFLKVAAWNLFSGWRRYLASFAVVGTATAAAQVPPGSNPAPHLEAEALKARGLELATTSITTRRSRHFARRSPQIRLTRTPTALPPRRCGSAHFSSRERSPPTTPGTSTIRRHPRARSAGNICGISNAHRSRARTC